MADYSGEIISHYEVGEQIGQGGMGVVYKAEDTKLKRTVALKFLSKELTRDPEAKERFLLEAQAAAALNHPNICTIYEIEEIEDQAFISMEFIQGQSLREKIREKTLNIEESVNFVVQIANGLKEAHDKGIVHRDIKSANIMLTEKGDAKITDFGLAKLAGSSIITREGTTMGTVAYMSPEQIRGKDIDHRTDIWSLGVVLFEMLTGEMPFKGEADQAIIYSILNEDPDSLIKLNKDVPPELNNIVTKMLAKTPKDRYQNVDKLLDDIQGKSAKSDKKTSLFLNFDKKSKYKKLLVSPILWMVIIFLFGLAGGMLLFSPFQPTHFSGRDWILMLDFENLSGEDIFHGTIREALSIDLQQSKYVNIFSQQRITEALRLMEIKKGTSIDEKLGREICLREGIKALLTGSIGKLGEIYFINVKIIDPATADAIWTEKVSASNQEQIYNAVDELSKLIRRNLGESLSSIKQRDKPLEKATTTSLQALRYLTIGKEFMNKAEWTEAIPYYKRAIEEDSTFATAYSNLGVIFHNMGNNIEALKYSSLAMRWINNVSDRERYYIEAEYYRYRDLFDKAIENYKILIRLYPDHFSGYNNLAFVYQYTRQYSEAIEQLKEAARISPKSWYVFQNLGLNYGGLGELDKAVKNFNKALEMNQNQYWSNLGLAMIYLMKNEIDKSKNQIDLIFKGGERWQSIGEVWIASLFRYRGKYNEALLHLKKGIRIDQRIDNKSSEAAKRIIVSNIYYVKGKKQLSLTEAEKAIAIFPSEYNLMKLGINYAKYNMFEKANMTLQKLETLIKKQETRVNQAQLFRLKGELEFYKQNNKEAARFLEKSKSLVNNLVTRFSLAKAYRKAGEYKNAVSELEYIINHQWATIFDGLIPLWVDSHLNLAQSYELQHDTSKAIFHYEKYLSIRKDADKDLLEPKIATKCLDRLKN